MKVLITGSGGLIGSQCAEYFHEKGCKIYGIDNDTRYKLFKTSVRKQVHRLLQLEHYTHIEQDIREKSISETVRKIKPDVIIHAAAQPSHDYAASYPFIDFHINATGTLNLLEAARKHAKGAVFIFTSTNKVYGDNPNKLYLQEFRTRFDIPDYAIDESMSLDHCTHSLFGCSKVYADLAVQEYGKNFGMYTVSFRGGCLTGGAQAGAQQHGFLNYLVKTILAGEKYTVYGYNGKQVRDNIHALDVASAFWEFAQNPKKGEVYNIGGGRKNSCSVLEAIEMTEKMWRRSLNYNVSHIPRTGDHKWYISDMTKFKRDYPNWKITYDLQEIIKEIYGFNSVPSPS